MAILTPATGGNISWVCTLTGTPGTWLSFGQNGTMSSIGGTPNFIGEVSVTGGLAYISTGISTPADWKQITN